MNIRAFARAALTVLIVGVCPATGAAQPAPPRRNAPTEPQGIVVEADAITRAAIFADRNLGKGDLNDGFYVEFGHMIPGAGWLSVGPGYRHWHRRDQIFVSGSASVSRTGYMVANGRFELPKLLRSRVMLGTQYELQDFQLVEFFGVGPESRRDDRSEYHVRARYAVGYATLRPIRWLGLDTQVGWLTPSTVRTSGSLLPVAKEQRSFAPIEVSVTADTRDFPSHPTRGVLLRGASTRFVDRDTDADTFTQNESEAAGFIPLAGGRLVLAAHGWLVSSSADAGRSIPYYLLPSLGGGNTLRSYGNYRFHDRNFLVINAEARLALMTHLELAVFADAGNVAAHLDDLNLAKQSYGLGVRLHTRRQAFALLDVAHGDEGWRTIFRMTDPLDLSRLTRRALAAPFVP